MHYKNLTDVLSSFGHTAEFAGIDLIEPNQQGIFGTRPLGIAATIGDIEAIEILLEAGADIDGKGEDGYTPLHDAVAHGKLEAIRYLLKKGASLTSVNDDGETPRQLAESIRREDVIKLIDEIA